MKRVLLPAIARNIGYNGYSEIIYIEQQKSKKPNELQFVKFVFFIISSVAEKTEQRNKRRRIKNSHERRVEKWQGKEDPKEI